LTEPSVTSPKNPNPLEAREAAWFRRQYERGYSLASMARELRVGPKRLGKLAKRMGFPARPRYGPRWRALLPPLPRFRPPKPSAKRRLVAPFPHPDDLLRWDRVIQPGWAVHDRPRKIA
jgi:hypothetical protein